MLRKIILSILISFILKSCQSNFDPRLVGNYKVNNFEKNDTSADFIFNPKVSLCLYANKTFKLVSRDVEDSGRWESSSLKEFNNITFYFEGKIIFFFRS